MPVSLRLAPETLRDTCFLTDRRYGKELLQTAEEKMSQVILQITPDHKLQESKEDVKRDLLMNVRDPSEHADVAYASLVNRILDYGSMISDRTGNGTMSRFGEMISFDLTKGFPLLTTKRVFWKGIKAELLWFIRGCTDTKDLSKQGVRIWDDNTSRRTLDKLGFIDREEGDLGPGYGFQWRHCGAEYKDCKTDYGGQGIDQLRDVVRVCRDSYFCKFF